MAPAPMPPQGAQAQSQPQAQPQQSQGQSPAAQAVQMIHQGYQALGKMIQQAGGSLPPEDMQLFQQASKATEALIQSLSQPSQPQKPQAAPPQAGGPMAAHQAKGSTPAPQY